MGNSTQNMGNDAIPMYDPCVICISTSILFYWLLLLCSKPQLYRFTFTEVHSFSFLSLPVIPIERVVPVSASYLPRFQKKNPNPKPTVPIKYLSSALFVVLRQIPPCSSPWPWCLENSWQYTLSCWLMQLLCFLIPHIGLLSFVLDLDYKAICPSIYSAELKCSPATTGAIKYNNQINKFWKIRGK